MTDFEGLALVVFILGSFLGMIVERLMPERVAALVDRLLLLVRRLLRRAPLVPYRGRHRVHLPAGRHAAPDSTGREIPPSPIRLVVPSLVDGGALAVDQATGRHARVKVAA